MPGMIAQGMHLAFIGHCDQGIGRAQVDANGALTNGVCFGLALPGFCYIQ